MKKLTFLCLKIHMNKQEWRARNRGFPSHDYQGMALSDVVTQKMYQNLKTR
jgi:hypothetical protein